MGLTWCQLQTTLDEIRRTRPLRQRSAVVRKKIRNKITWQFVKLGRALRGEPIIPRGDAPRTAAVQPPDLQPGAWVRVKDYEDIQSTLIEGATDGMAYVPAVMNKYCGQVMKVHKRLDFFYDEVSKKLLRMKKQSPTVLLEGAACDGSQFSGGECDRNCLIFWRACWLQPLSPQEVPTPAKPAEVGNKATEVSPLVSAFSGTERADPDGALRIKPGALVRVKSQDEILSTLDRRAVCGGVSFIGEHMRQYCGSVFVVDKCIKCFYDEKDSCYAQLENTFALAGVYCGGRQPEGSRVCDRGCALFWKGEWLEPLANATAARPGRA